MLSPQIEALVSVSGGRLCRPDLDILNPYQLSAGGLSNLPPRLPFTTAAIKKHIMLNEAVANFTYV